jgi:hypothetical protein
MPPGLLSRSRRRRAHDPHPELAFGGLPMTPVRGKLGVPPKGSAQPSKHELAILRRAALSAVMVTQTLHGIRYVYADSGETICDDRKNPLTEPQFHRLAMWLTPQRDGLFDLATAQTWRVKKVTV